MKFEIDELVAEILDQLPSSVWTSNSTTFLDPAIGGGQFVRAVEQRLRSQPVLPQFQAEVDKIIDFMNNGDSLDGNLLRMNIKELDNRRNQSLSNVAPELAQVINYEA
jgi:hypothetical protein